tara:strand:+ start:1248 stop:3644 length:2397 start_codon:yes stop_codon:yes gene_type:complete
MKKNLFLIFTIYSIIGIIVFEALDNKLFTFLYQNGFEVIIKFIFSESTNFIEKYIILADLNFYYLYFSFFILMVAIFLIVNLKKVVFSKNFIIQNKELNFSNLGKKEIFLNVILAAGLSLFLELSIIRIHSSYLHFFSYLKNISLLSCFLGLGIGYALKKYKIYSVNWIFPLLTLQIIMLYFLSQTPVSIILINPIAEQLTMGQDTARGIVHLLMIYSFIVFIFLFNAMCFIPIGHLISRLMNNIESLTAYSLNLIGSFFGIILFVILSFLLTPPVIWITFSFILFLIILRKSLQNYFFSIICVLFLIITLSLDLKNKKETIYSPYQNITVERLTTPLNPVILQTSHLFYQAMLNLSDKLSFDNSWRTKGNIFGAHVDVDHEREFYNLPFLIKKTLPESILIVGSGSGNDVAAANRFDIKSIDAVEIDPIIAELGRKYHPESPYNNNNVNLVIDDARTFIKNSKNEYDVIVYGLLDSQSNLSSKGGIRLDSYVYTVEALTEAKNKLKKNGFIFISFFVQTPEIGYKIFGMLEKATGIKPTVLKSKTNSRYIFIGAKKNPEIQIDKLKYFKINKEFNGENFYDIDLSTDDWPFLYMPSKVYPFTYLSIIIVLLSFSIYFLNKLIKIKTSNFSASCFFLGAGFMLVETKGITEIAKIYGSTWVVISIVIAAVLFMSFIANLIVMKKFKISSTSTYSLLLISLIIGYYLFTQDSIHMPSNINKIIMPIILTLPILFSGIAFSKELLKLQSISQALSSNILGAMVGGFLEYNSMYFGFANLYVLAGVIYLSAFVFSKSRSIS